MSEYLVRVKADSVIVPIPNCRLEHRASYRIGARSEAQYDPSEWIAGNFATQVLFCAGNLTFSLLILTAKAKAELNRIYGPALHWNCVMLDAQTQPVYERVSVCVIADGIVCFVYVYYWSA